MKVGDKRNRKKAHLAAASNSRNDNNNNSNNSNSNNRINCPRGNNRANN